MTLDDETADLIEEARRLLASNQWTTGWAEPLADRLLHALEAGYAARDAEVEELRAALAKVRERAEGIALQPDPPADDEMAGQINAAGDVLAILDWMTERETPADEWEYQYIPVTADGEEWAGRSREECDELIRAHADPNHWVHEPHNDDLYPVVSYRVERRRKAGPWMEVVPDDRA